MKVLSEDEIARRMNILLAKIVHELDQAGDVVGISPLTYLMYLDEMIAEWIEMEAKNAPTPESLAEPSTQVYEEMYVMSRLYLELYDQLDDVSKNIHDCGR
jgi:hypothetical protein